MPHLDGASVVLAVSSRFARPERRSLDAAAREEQTASSQNLVRLLLVVAIIAIIAMIAMIAMIAIIAILARIARIAIVYFGVQNRTSKT